MTTNKESDGDKAKVLFVERRYRKERDHEEEMKVRGCPKRYKVLESLTNGIGYWSKVTIRKHALQS